MTQETGGGIEVSQPERTANKKTFNLREGKEGHPQIRRKTVRLAGLILLFGGEAGPAVCETVTSILATMS